MLIVELSGGLGNQLFQYAFGCGLAEKLGQEVKFDCSMYMTGEQTRRGFVPREYGLNMFKIELSLAMATEIAELKVIKPNLIFRQFSRIWRRMLPYKYQHYITERVKRFNPTIFTIPVDCYLEGHWQTEKYFKHIEADLRKRLVFARKTENALVKNIQETNSVLLHFRRGDFLNVYNLCDIQYYQRALAVISSKQRDIVLFVFSDDLLWVQQNFKTNLKCVFVAGNNQADDLQLMSLCKHSIIANSTFSWWGAWLNSNPNKIVVAPASMRKSNNRDIIPESWIVL